MSTAAVGAHPGELAPGRMARIAGLFYLFNILTIFLAIFCFRGIIVPRDAAATAANLLAHEAQYRLGLSLEVISTACSIVVAVLFFALLKPVDKNLSLLAAVFRLMACALALVGYLFQLAPLQILGPSQSLSTIQPNELPAIGLLLQRLHVPASDMVIVFFGFHFFVLGYLIFRSGFLPRALGVLSIVSSLGALIYLAPPLARILSPYILGLGFILEVSLTAWLLLKGVDVERWRTLAGANAPS